MHLLFLGVFALTVWSLGENLLLLLACLSLGGVGVAYGLARRNVRGLAVLRRLPARARVGRPTPIGYQVARGRGPPAVGLRLSECEPRGLRPAPADLELGPVPGGGSVGAALAVTFPRRGRHRLGAVEVASRYPFGLFEARVQVPLPDETLVLPREGRATLRLREHLRGPRHRARAAAHTRGAEELYGVQEFRPGDDPRRLHWKSSARRGVLVRTQWRAEPGRELLVVLGPGRGPPAAFERAVSVAATVLRECRGLGLPAHLVLGDGQDRPVGRAPPPPAAPLARLALVRPRRGRQPLRAARARLGGPRPPAVLWVATGPEPRVARALRVAGAVVTVLRADQPGIRRYVRGLS